MTKQQLLQPTYQKSYQKDFEGWSQAIPLINQQESPQFEVKEIWWCNIGVNIGTEADGNKPNNDISYFYTRPVLILKKLSNNSFIALPMSKKIKQGSWYYPIQIQSNSSNLLFHQIRSFDARRLTSKIARISDEQLQIIKNVFTNFILD
ncbi:type II toxin-antitoxin system PemK/MazF family toxin [Candidatus Gracilibacteria bacterium]|nr:type II toxin-antitoxin system PemK/MazF family toxin [Thermales bacterium]NJL97100.1 type II toxin-antitoxin system PemK/MazF family toxin [Candidatus Gracilibacteria bacterium]